MTDLTRLLREALPADPAALDMLAVRDRSRSLSVRRRLAAGAAAGLALSLAAGVAFAGVLGRGSDLLDQAGPAPAPSMPVPPAFGAAGRVVQLHFSMGCGDISPVQRRVEGPVLAASLKALFAGPTAAEAAAGTVSAFGPPTAGLLRSVRKANGSAYVDLDGALRGKVDLRSDEAGCGNFGEQVGGTLRQFGGIGAVYYAWDGDPAAFVKDAGGTCPTRPEPGGLCDPMPFSTSAAASSDGREVEPAVAGACSDERERDVVEVVLQADGVPSPRCTRVRRSQRLAVANETLTEIVAQLPDGAALTVPSGASRTFPGTLSEHTEDSDRLRVALTPDAAAELVLSDG